MRKMLLGTVLALVTIVPLAMAQMPSAGYAQVGFVQGTEFDGVFGAPWVAKCGVNATTLTSACPDPQTNGGQTWSWNGESPGQLRIYTQFGTLAGAANNARNFIVQPYNVGLDFTVTTKMTFPATLASFVHEGQSAGLIAYLNDDNYITVSRVYPEGTSGLAGSQLQFNWELNGTQVGSASIPEAYYTPVIYLRLNKSGNFYTAQYSYDNVNFTNFFANAVTPTPNTSPTATTTATPTVGPSPTPQTAGYSADFTSGQPFVGVFAWGGPNPAVNSGGVLPADFDWFRVGNSATPAPTALPTSTGVPTATATSVATSTVLPTATAVNTVTPTATAAPSATATSAPTATAAPTNTPVPTPTPRPSPPPAKVGFRYISVWYHQVRVNTFDHLAVQTSQRVRHGIWVHVYFPSGRHLDYYQNTNNSGYWTTEFNIPAAAQSRYSNVAVVTFQLWRGKKTARDFVTFAIVR